MKANEANIASAMTSTIGSSDLTSRLPNLRFGGIRVDDV